MASTCFNGVSRSDQESEVVLRHVDKCWVDVRSGLDA